MLVGHAAVALAGKRIEPEAPLGGLMLASFAADLGWCVLVAAGVEHARMIERGPTLTRSIVDFDFAYSHSLVGLIVLGALFAAVALAMRRSPRTAALVATAVVSHWFLDVASHNPDMPIVAGGRQLLGFGLWNSIPATLLVEGGAWLAAVIAFARFPVRPARAGAYVFWFVVAVLTLAWWNNIAGPPPADLSGMAATSGVFFSLVVASAFWIDRRN